jgi:hypothetical protein
LAADLLRSGTDDDEWALPDALLPRAWALLVLLFDRAERAEVPGDDPMSQAISTPRGRTLEAILSHIFRSCRLADRANGGGVEVWGEFRVVLAQELEKCRNANFEVSTLLASNLAQLQVIDATWLAASTEKIFPADAPVSLECAIEGLGYATVSAPLYRLLRDQGVVERALCLRTAKRHGLEQLVATVVHAYLWGEEDLASPRFNILFNSERSGLLVGFLTSSLGQVDGRELSLEQVDKVLSLWQAVMEWVDSQPQEIPAMVSSNLPMVAAHVQVLDERSNRMLFNVARFVCQTNAYEFFRELDRLTDTAPVTAAAILGRVLDTFVPDYDFEDRLGSVLRKISTKQRDCAVILSDKLRHLSSARDLYVRLTSAT